MRRHGNGKLKIPHFRKLMPSLYYIDMSLAGLTMICHTAYSCARSFVNYKHKEGFRERSAHIHPLLQLFLQPQWTSSFQPTTIAGSYGNPSQLQVQKRVSNI